MPEPIENLLGLGPKSAAWLRDVGIETRVDLEQAGVVHAYLRVQASGKNVSLNLLWALQGALTNTHWTKLTAEVKDRLRDEIKDAMR